MGTALVYVATKGFPQAKIKVKAKVKVKVNRASKYLAPVKRCLKDCLIDVSFFFIVFILYLMCLLLLLVKGN